MQKSYFRAFGLTAIITFILIYFTPLFLIFGAPLFTTFTISIVAGLILFLVHNNIKSVHEFSKYFEEKRRHGMTTFLLPFFTTLLLLLVVEFALKERLNRAFAEEGIYTNATVTYRNNYLYPVNSYFPGDRFKVKIFYYDALRKAKFVQNIDLGSTFFYKSNNSKTIPIYYLKSKPNIIKLAPEMMFDNMEEYRW